MFSKFKKELSHLLDNALHMDANSNLDGPTWQKLFNSYQALITRALNAEAFSVFVYDPVTEDIWLKSGTGVAERQITVMKDDSIVGKVITDGQPIIDNDMADHKGAHQQTDKTTGFTTRTILCVPIKNHETDNIIGAISILNKKDDSGFTVEDLETAEGLAFILQMAIEDIFFNQREGERLEQFVEQTEKAMGVLFAIIVGGMFLLMTSMVGMVVFLKLYS